MLSPVRLSSACNVRAPYSAGWNFRQYFFAVWYLGRPLTSTENFTEIVPGEPPPSVGLNAKGVAKYSDFWHFVGKRCKIGGKIVLITDRKSYMSFRLVPKSVTLNDLERQMALILRYFTEFGSFRGPLRKSGWRSHRYFPSSLELYFKVFTYTCQHCIMANNSTLSNQSS